ncbi:MAG: DUF998 domain-containing protein [Lysobacter sp.]
MKELVGRRVRRARLLALATIFFAVAFYTVGAAIKPGYSHAANFISELNATGTPWALALGLAGFLPLGLLFAAFLVTAIPIAQVSGASRLGLWLLWSQPAAFIGTAFAPCDAGCPIGGSALQVAHDALGLITYLSCALALALLSSEKTLSRGLRLFLGIAAIAWLVLFVAMVQPEAMQVRGFLQRIAEGLLATSILIVAWRMLGDTPSRGLIQTPDSSNNEDVAGPVHDKVTRRTR